MRALREPLTSTQSPGASSRATRSASSSRSREDGDPLRGHAGRRGAVGDLRARAVPSAKSSVDPERRGEPSELAVRFRRRRAELAHLAEHREAAPVAAPLREHAQRHFHRLRIRVVGVVDQHDAARQIDALEPSVRGLEAREARGERLERGARGLRGGRGGERVHERRLAEPRDAGGDAPDRRHELEGEAAGVELAHLLRAHVRACVAAEAHDGRVRAAREPEAVIDGDDGGAVRGQGREQVALLERDRLARAQVLDVRAAHVGDHPDARLRDRRERRDLAAVVHADLDHHAAVALAAAQQRQRQAELVVQVALRLEAGRRAARGSPRTSPWWWSCRCCR